ITDRTRTEDALRRTEIELQLRANHHFLSEASAAFSASLDFETALSNIARMTIPRLADGCVVDTVQTDGTLRRSAVAHSNPAKEAALWELGRIVAIGNDALGKSRISRTSRSEPFMCV